MKYSEMKIAAKAYFNRNWNREDMLNPNEIPGHAHKTLKKWIWEAGGLYTVLSTVASLLWLYLTLPWSVRKRVLLLMIAVFSFGADGKHCVDFCC
ncbi:hypothetical protein BC332_03119 [Capsicum chinense]|nr:hypothetical protein BC332_03119 [Capsicum chinense]